MKIDKTSKPLPPQAPSGDGRARSPVAKNADTSSSTPSSSTSVNLGATSAQLRDMENSTAGTPVVNAAKVAEIKQAISEGRFQVNSGAVADSLIKSVTDLISAQKA